ncbi:MAG: CoA-binding protein, partial [Pseudomonadota bacterium]
MVTDTELREALEDARVIALVGASPDPARPSHSVGEYLAGCGYRVVGFFPHAACEVLFGERV